MFQSKFKVILLVCVVMIAFLSISIFSNKNIVLERSGMTPVPNNLSIEEPQYKKIGASNNQNIANDYDQVTLDNCGLSVKYLKKDIRLEYDSQEETLSVLSKIDLENSFLMSLSCSKNIDATFQTIDCYYLKSLQFFSLPELQNQCYLGHGKGTIEMIVYNERKIYFNISHQLLNSDTIEKKGVELLGKFQIQSAQSIKLESNIRLDEITKKPKKIKINDYEYSLEEFIKYDQCQDPNNPIEVSKEHISEKYNIKFILLTNKKVCGMYYFSSNVVSVTKSGKIILISAGLGGFDQEMSFSPSGEYLMIVDGAHSGAAYHTSGVKIFNIKKNKVVYTNLIDLDGRGGIDKYYQQTTADIKWLDDHTLKYSETLTPNTCEIKNDLLDDKCAQINISSVNVESL